MRDSECVAFLQWALPHLHLRWEGFRKVRGLVCKRLARRLRHLALTELWTYRSYLEQHEQEWAFLDSICRIPISRFYRDRAVFDFLAREVLPHLARSAAKRPDGTIACWSAGCASGEEPYTIALIWRFHLKPAFPDVALRIEATDVESHAIERGRRGCYRASNLRELPRDWCDKRVFARRRAIPLER